MENRAYFENAAGAGDLFLEHIFYEFEGEPIVFTCVNQDDEIYLCLCSEIRYGQKWILSPCSAKVLRDLVEERTDIASAFRSSDFLIVAEMDLQGQERTRIIDTESVDELDLPKEGLLLRCDKDAAHRYLYWKFHETRETITYSVCIGADFMFDMEVFRGRQRSSDMQGRLREYGRWLMTNQVYHTKRRTEYCNMLDVNGGDGDAFLMAA